MQAMNREDLTMSTKSSHRRTDITPCRLESSGHHLQGALVVREPTASLSWHTPSGNESETSLWKQVDSVRMYFWYFLTTTFNYNARTKGLSIMDEWRQVRSLAAPVLRCQSFSVLFLTLASPPPQVALKWRGQRTAGATETSTPVAKCQVPFLRSGSNGVRHRNNLFGHGT